MKSLSHRRLVPIASLMFMGGLLLTSLSLLLDVPVPEKFLVTTSSIKVFALLDIGKWVKSQAHEQYREDMREGFSIDEHPWIVLRFSRAAQLNVVRAQKDGEAWLKRNLHAEYLGKTDILRVWLSDGSPLEKAVIVDTIIRGYLQDIEQNRVPYLKEGIAVARRTLSLYAQDLDRAENELRKLNIVTPLNMDDMEYLWLIRNSLEKNIAFAKKSITISRASIEYYEEALRTLPRIVKWAGKPRPEE